MSSFFKRPSWASRGDENSASDFYRRSGQIYADIVAANKKARDRSTDRVSGDSTEDSKTCKHRKASEEGLQEDVHAVLDDHILVHGAIHDQEKSSTTSEPCPDSVVQDGNDRSASQSPEVTAPANIGIPNNETIIALPDPSVSSKTGPTYLERTTHSPESVPGNNGGGNSHERSDHQNAQSHGQNNIDQDSEIAHADPVVQILITSEIENTKPLIVHRKMSQSLREVRLAWCKRQNLPEGLQSSVFLTWKGRRLFDVTTCKSLAINVKGNSSRSSETNDFFQADEEDVRIHMEAVTEDLLKSNGRQLSSGVGSKSFSKSEKVESEDQTSLISIVMKCPSFEDFKMNASLKMQISRLIAAFRDAKDIPPEQDVYTVFDGDRLDPKSCLADYDIADHDLLDVIIK